MRISKIEFENFRNFKDYNEIVFPTDGTISVIYGTNGAGKTTLHQLFQWIIYGTVKFNRTTNNDILYNHSKCAETPKNSEFRVYGKIEFEHPNESGVIENYSLTREYFYRNGLHDVELLAEKSYLSLMKKVGSDWKSISQEPEEIKKKVQQILPEGLSQYFFFDGENMIADLNNTGKASANNLKKALYSILDLDVYNEALADIGKESSTTTVLGMLQKQKSAKSTDSNIETLSAQLSQRKVRLERAENKLNKAEEKLEELNIRKTELSEKIGGTPDANYLQKNRKHAEDTIKRYYDSIATEKGYFGQSVMRMAPGALLSKTIQEAQDMISLRVDEEHLIPGIRKPFVEALLKESMCVCGRHLSDVEYDHIRQLLTQLPPNSYKQIYDEFTRRAKSMSRDFEPEKLTKHLDNIFSYQKGIDKERDHIKEIDEQLAVSKSKSDLVQKRQEVERAIAVFSKSKEDAISEKTLETKLYERVEKDYNTATNGLAANKKLLVQIEVLNEVKKYFEEKIELITDDYSKRLENNIQILTTQMLTSVRYISMDKDFNLKVEDSYGDQSKSEGQFAVVSFSYIGGIFKLLREVDALSHKEYPLVLDGPFSKLDRIQRQNVIDVIPGYAPQVIMFSKDDLSDCFSDDEQINIWTIVSNNEKNIARVEKGYNPKMFNNEGVEL